jgi:peptidase E
MTKQIIAFGDGMLDSKSPYADLYILAQTGKTKPKVLFLGTASGDNAGYTKYFYQMFDRFNCRTFDLALFHPDTADIAGLIMDMDAIIVGGGQSKSMMGTWKEWDLPSILFAAYNNGTVLAGGSAGSVCWFDECITDSIPGSLTVMSCLGFLPHSNCPHYTSYSRRSAYTKFVSSNEIKSGYAADDYAGLHFIDGKFSHAISNRHYAHCFEVKNENGKAIQKRLKTDWLGLKKYQDAYIFNTPMFEHLKEIKEPKQNDQPPLDAAC